MLSKPTSSEIDRIVPYVLRDGVPTLRDSSIMGLFDRVVEEDLLRVTFPDGSVGDRERFLTFMKSPGVLLDLYCVGREVMGFSWLVGKHHRVAWGHFCFFRAAWGGHARRLGVLGLRSLLHAKGAEGEYLLNLILGPVPKANRFAAAAVEAVGGRLAAELPYGAWNAAEGSDGPLLLFAFTREQFPLEE